MPTPSDAPNDSRVCWNCGRNKTAYRYIGTPCCAMFGTPSPTPERVSEEQMAEIVARDARLEAHHIERASASDDRRALLSHIAALEAELSRLRREAGADARDAARYRWLRRHGSYSPFIAMRGPGGVSQLTEEYADAAIDAALSASTTNTKEST